MTTLLLNSSFEIAGETFTRIISSNFGIHNNQSIDKIVEEGNTSFALSGIITKNTGIDNIPVPNAKVVALKKGIIYDYDITRSDGSYFLYLEEGVYDIRIEGQTYNRVIKNCEIPAGEAIRPYRKIITEGQILEKVYDTIKFVSYDELGNVIDSNQRLVSGIIIDEHGKPVEGAEIILGEIDNVNNTRKIHAFVKTCSNGHYHFMAKEGYYDVVLRSPKHPAKSIKNYYFDLTKGFMPPIIQEKLIFKNGGEWMWISN